MSFQSSPISTHHILVELKSCIALRCMYDVNSWQLLFGLVSCDRLKCTYLVIVVSSLKNMLICNM